MPMSCASLPVIQDSVHPEQRANAVTTLGLARVRAAAAIHALKMPIASTSRAIVESARPSLVARAPRPVVEFKHVMSKENPV